MLEFETSPDYRSSMDLKLDKNSIIITIDAEDATSFRASINSAIKWIKLSVEINELTENYRGVRPRLEGKQRTPLFS